MGIGSDNRHDAVLITPCSAVSSKARAEPLKRIHDKQCNLVSRGTIAFRRETKYICRGETDAGGRAEARLLPVTENPHGLAPPLMLHVEQIVAGEIRKIIQEILSATCSERH